MKKSKRYPSYFSVESLQEHPERLEYFLQYGEEHNWYDYVDREELAEGILSGSLTKVYYDLLHDHGYKDEDSGKYVINSDAYYIARSIYERWDITEATGLKQEEERANEGKPSAAKLESVVKWDKEETERINKWKELGYTVDTDTYTATKDGVTVEIEPTYYGHSRVPSEYQTSAASEANKKPVYIDGIKYNSITEAANAVGISTKTIQRNIDDGKAHKGHTYSSTPVETKTEEIKQEEARTEYVYKQEQTAEDKCEAVLKDCYNKCAKELNTFYDKLEDGYTPTKSELDRMSQYQVMCKNMDEHISEAGKQELVIIKDSLEETAATVLVGYSEEHIEAIANSEFHGANYSERVWNNTETLAEKAKEAVTEAVVLGKSVQEAARDLAAETTQGRNATERLIRTETARVYNKAEEKLYKDVGVEEVEVLVEHDACDDCKALEGKKFKITEAPKLPLHPNCRCDMIPVI